MPSSLRRITRNLSWLTAGEAVVRLALLALVILIARGMGPSAVGTFTVAASLAWVTVPLLASGQAEVLIRECAGDPQRTRSLLSRARRLQGRLGLAIVPVAVIAIMFIPQTDLRWLTLTFVPYTLLRVEILTRGAAFKGLDHMDVEVKARILEFGVALALTAPLAAFHAPIWSVGLALTLGAFLGVVLLARSEMLFRGGLEDTLDLVGGLVQGAPFVGLAVGLQILLRSDVLLAKALSLDDATIGQYSAAANLVWGTLVVAQLTGLAFFPTFSRMAKRGLQPGPAAFGIWAAGLTVGGLVAVIFWWAPGLILNLLFGQEFQAAGELLATLAWALPGASATMALGVVLAAWRRQNLGLILLIVTAAASVSLNLHWIPRLGMQGAAIVACGVHSAAALANLALAAWPRSEGTA